ncbi:DUF2029 domain-containing protein [bacterium]|nr:DUF2029 domain-containing protein [bacterium]
MKRSGTLSILFIVLAFSLLVSVVLPAIKLLNTQALDFKSYYIAGHLALEQKNIYDPLLQLEVSRKQALSQNFYPYIYFPMLALMCMPFAMLSFNAAQWIWFGLSTIFLYASLGVLSKLISDYVPGSVQQRRVLGMIIVLACSIMETFYTNAINGQVNTLILLLLVLFIAALSKNRDIAGGICLGFLIIIKPQPAIIIPYLLLTRRFRTAISTILTATIGTIITSWIIGVNNFIYYLKEVAPTFNMIKTSFPPIMIHAPPNSSLPGALSRLFLDSPGTTAPFSQVTYVALISRLAVVGILITTFILIIKRSIQSKPTFAVLWLNSSWLILVSLIISPLTWSHHYVLLLVLFIPYLVAAWSLRNKMIFLSIAACWLTLSIPMFPMHVRVSNLEFVHLALSIQTLAMLVLWILIGIFMPKLSRGLRETINCN